MSSRLSASACISDSQPPRQPAVWFLCRDRQGDILRGVDERDAIEAAIAGAEFRSDHPADRPAYRRQAGVSWQCSGSQFARVEARPAVLDFNEPRPRLDPRPALPHAGHSGEPSLFELFRPIRSGHGSDPGEDRRTASAALRRCNHGERRQLPCRSGYRAWLVRIRPRRFFERTRSGPGRRRGGQYLQLHDVTSELPGSCRNSGRACDRFRTLCTGNGSRQRHSLDHGQCSRTLHPEPGRPLTAWRSREPGLLHKLRDESRPGWICSADLRYGLWPA